MLDYLRKLILLSDKAKLWKDYSRLIYQQFLSCTTSRGRQWLRQTGHYSLISRVLMMHDQQKVCPHFVALFSFKSS